MTVIAFIGKPRTGKTLFMTFNGYNNYYTKKHTIFCNYKLYFPNVLMSPYDMLKIPFTDVDRSPKTLMIQEADKWFDARRSLRNENVLLSSLTGQSGKRNLDIFYDTQFYNRVDSTLRDVTEYKFHSTVYIDSRDKKPLAFEYILTDEDDNIIRTLPPIPASLLKPYFDLYDSYDPTIPMIESRTMKDISEGMKSDTTKRKSTNKRTD